MRARLILPLVLAAACSSPEPHRMGDLRNPPTLPFYQVSCTGTADDVRIQAAVNATPQRPVQLLPGTCTIAKHVALPAGTDLYLTPTTVIHQQMVGATDYGAFTANSVYGTQTLITANNTVGSVIINSAVNYTAETWLFIADAAQLRGNLYRVVSSSSDGGGHFNLVLDRPVQWSFVTNDLIFPVTTLMHDVRIHANGAAFSGTTTGSGLGGVISFGGCYHCYLYDGTVDGRFGLTSDGPATLVNFDIGSFESGVYRTSVDCRDQTTHTNLHIWGVAFQSCERCIAEDVHARNCVDGFIDLAGYGNKVRGGSAESCVEGVELTSSENSCTGASHFEAAGVNLTGNYEGVKIHNCASHNTIRAKIDSSSVNGIVVSNDFGGTAGNIIENTSIVGVGVPPTTIASGSNNQPLPQSVINVASTAGYIPGSYLIGTLATNVTCTGIATGQLTGCTGGSGTMHTGNTVTSGGSAAVLFNGASHEAKIRDLTTGLTHNSAINIGGNSSRVIVDGWTSLDDGLDGTGGFDPAFISGTSSLFISNARISSSQARAASAFLVEVQGGGFLSLDSVIFDQLTSSGASSILAVGNYNGGCGTLRTRNVQLLGTALGWGLYATTPGCASYLGEGTDFSNASVQVNPGGTITLSQGRGVYTSVATTGTDTLSQAAAMGNVITSAASLSGNVTVNVPAGFTGIVYDAFNNTTANGHTWSVGVTSGANVTIGAGKHAFVSCEDGANMKRVTVDQ